MSVKRVDPETAHRLMRDEGYRYLDVRSVPEFDEGHPEGAYNIPLQQPGAAGMQDNPQFVEQVKRTFSPDTPLVLGCRTGNRSLTAAHLLLEAGYTRVVEQQAGFAGVRDPFGRVTHQGWQALGLPSEQGAQPGHSFAELRGDADGD